MLPYYGSVSTKCLILPDLPDSSKIALQLYQKLWNEKPRATGYHIFTDRYFTVKALAQELLQLWCYLTGTLRTSRLKNDILLLAWKDTRIVTILSSYGTSDRRTIERRVKEDGSHNITKQYVIKNDNMNMGDCFMRKSCKLWRFFSGGIRGMRNQ